MQLSCHLIRRSTMPQARRPEHDLCTIEGLKVVRVIEDFEQTSITQSPQELALNRPIERVHSKLVIGFDLDQTLYPKSPLIDEAIQSYIYGVIAKRKQIPLDEARKLFLAQYPTISGRKTLLLLGFDDAEQIIQESLERAEIEPFLKPDPEVLDLLCELQQTYGGLTLITGSSAEIARRKLSKLGLPVSLFSFMITGEVSKSDGTAFRIWMAQEQAKNPALNAS